MSYIELHARSAFNFLRGASQPEHLAERAAKLGMTGLALCDRDGLYGAPRLYAAAREYGIRSIVGAELTMEGGAVLPVLVASRKGYQNLSRLITAAKLRGTKTQCSVQWEELPLHAEGLIALTGDKEGILGNPQTPEAYHHLQCLTAAFGRENVFLEIQRHFSRDEEWRNEALVELARKEKLPLVATNGVAYAEKTGRTLLDVFTCIREHTNLDAAGRLLSINDERHLKSAEEMREVFRDLPEAIENTMRIADRIDFTLENLGYEFPRFEVPGGGNMEAYLREQTYRGAKDRYGAVLSEKAKTQLERELNLICKLGFAGYFLIVWDIAKFCRENDILMQGRGSAANSAVCYSLGITACDPIKYDLLFERFLAEGRQTWPDIDLDLPSGDRREKVIQEVYRRYGKHGAAMTANVITYRGKSAMREISKALGFSTDVMDRFSSLYANGDFPHTLDLPSQLRQAGIPDSHPRLQAAVQLYGQIYGLPRHLGQHSGGMIICQNALSSIVPLENASMPGRVVAQWDKDDCEDLEIIKVDLLGLGMLSALQEAFALCEKRGHPVDLASIPQDDPATYDLLQRADTIGTFQVESRAQMATLPRMKPKYFYDVVVEVSIVRPGPIQGGLMHPYLARREGREEETYLDPRLERSLKRTLGVPLFQEQILQMAMEMGGFTGSEAEELRRALSFHRSQERMEKVCKKLRLAMEEKDVPSDVLEKVLQAVQSFAVYGFPESHAISFAYLAYASCWLKVHRASEFYCSLLNNQPMGFYSSATLIHDAKARGVQVRPVSILHSDWLCSIEQDGSIRLGIKQVRGLNEATGKRIVEERKTRPFDSLEDFRSRICPEKPALRTLARIGALNGLVEHRREGLWKVEMPILENGLTNSQASEASPLAPMNAFERMEADYAGVGATTGKHPMRLIRQDLPDVARACDLASLRNGSFIRIAGMVICRQRPGTAKGNVFISLEDETGVSNAIVSPSLFEKRRLVITQEPFLIIEGILQNQKGISLVRTRSVKALDYPEFASPDSHDFH